MRLLTYCFYDRLCYLATSRYPSLPQDCEPRCAHLDLAHHPRSSVSVSGVKYPKVSSLYRPTPLGVPARRSVPSESRLASPLPVTVRCPHPEEKLPYFYKSLTDITTDVNRYLYDVLVT